MEQKMKEDERKETAGEEVAANTEDALVFSEASGAEMEAKTVQEKVYALEEMDGRVEKIDNAKDFVHCGGLGVLREILTRSRQSELVMKAAQVLGTVCQNNIDSQEKAVTAGMVECGVALLERAQLPGVDVDVNFAGGSGRGGGGDDEKNVSPESVSFSVSPLEVCKAGLYALASMTDNCPSAVRAYLVSDPDLSKVRKAMERAATDGNGGTGEMTKVASTVFRRALAMLKSFLTLGGDIEGGGGGAEAVAGAGGTKQQLLAAMLRQHLGLYVCRFVGRGRDIAMREQVLRFLLKLVQVDPKQKADIVGGGGGNSSGNDHVHGKGDGGGEVRPVLKQRAADLLALSKQSQEDKDMYADELALTLKLSAHLYSGR